MFTRFATLLCALFVLSFGTALAHEGHDHGAESPAAPAQSGPRAAAATTDFELVVLPRAQELVLYLDRFATNEPILDAQIDVETPEGTARAEAAADGTYRLAAPWLARSGQVDLVATVFAGGKLDVLALDLHMPDPAEAELPVHAGENPSRLVQSFRLHLEHQGPLAAAAGGLLIGLAVFMLARARYVASALAVLTIAIVLLIGGVAFANDGDGDAEPPKPGSPSAITVAANLPQSAGVERAFRLPDGAIFVPKSMQRLLTLRTGVTADAQHRRTVELPGRIIADPNSSGVVQSSVGGRLAPPSNGFPALGAQVRKGDVLATVTPPVQAVDLSDMRQTQGNLDQQIDIVARRVARYEKLASSGSVAMTALDDARAELKGLQQRRAALDLSRRDPEELFAPVDGVIAERAAIAGQMAAPGTMVFRIVDPRKLFVEALSFEALDAGAAASARLPDGRMLSLSYRGSGLADRNQAVPVQFAIEGDTAGLRLGQFVNVLAPTTESVSGLAVPRASVLRSESGAVVYEHVAAERFEARPVRIAPLDAERVIVGKGLTAGQRIVTQGAELIDQVR